jgi:thioredoxin reductase
MLENAIVGSGPYGLSIAAHFRRAGIPFRIFGRVMDSWTDHMPKGMCLKSDGFASSLYDPGREYTLATFCAEKGIEYADAGIPVRLETFSAYGQAFRDRMVPDLQNNLVTGLKRIPNGFELTLDSGETLTARRVILAVGITHFGHIPAELAALPKTMVSHSFDHHDLEKFRGRSVVVIGGGSSATDLAGLLHEIGADVQLVTRQSALKFHGGPQAGQKPSLWQRVKRPRSGIGPGWRFRLLADAPWAFHFLPESFRLKVVRRALGPSGAYFAKDKVIGKVPLHLGCSTEGAVAQHGRVHLHLRDEHGTAHELQADHVVAATGYKVDLNRLEFLNPALRSQIECVSGSPSLSSHFESSVPGLYFAGLASANAFGPVMRFAFGAGFAARTLTRAVAKAKAHDPSAPSSAEKPLREIKVRTGAEEQHREKAGAASLGSSR